MSSREEPPTADDVQHRGPFSWILVGSVVALIVGDLLSSNTLLGFASLLFVPSWIILTLIHECAHAFVAQRLGWSVPILELGFGPVWRQLQIGGTKVSIRHYPIVGCAHTVPTHFNQPRLRSALIYAAGPLAEIVVILLLVATVGQDALLQPSDFWEGTAAVTSLAALISVAINLLPYRSDSGVPTDGLGILSAPFLPQSHFDCLYCEPIVSALVKQRNQNELTQTLERLKNLATSFPNVLLVHFEIACTLVLLDRRAEALFEFQQHVSQLPAAQRPLATSYFNRLRSFPKPIEEPFSWD